MGCQSTRTKSEDLVGIKDRHVCADESAQGRVSGLQHDDLFVVEVLGHIEHPLDELLKGGRTSSEHKTCLTYDPTGQIR